MDYIKWIRKKVGHEKIFLNFAGGCIVNEHGQILLQRRADKEQWGFPGGAMELGESAEETAKREIMEETGLEVEILQLIGVYTKIFDVYPNSDQCQSILFFFKVKVLGGELKFDGEETLELRFFDLDKVPKLVNQQHEELLKDVRCKRVGVFK